MCSSFAQRLMLADDCIWLSSEMPLPAAGASNAEDEVEMKRMPQKLVKLVRDACWVCQWHCRKSDVEHEGQGM